MTYVLSHMVKAQPQQKKRPVYRDRGNGLLANAELCIWYYQGKGTGSISFIPVHSGLSLPPESEVGMSHSRKY